MLSYLLILHLEFHIIYHWIVSLILNPPSPLGTTTNMAPIIILELKHDPIAYRLFPNLRRPFKVLPHYLSRFPLHKAL